MLKKKEHYFEVLEIEETENYREAEMAYLRMLKKWNPDRYYRYPSLRIHAEIKTNEVHEAFLKVSKGLKPANTMDTAVIDWHGYFNEHTTQRREETRVPRAFLKQFSFLLNPVKKFTDAVVYLLLERPLVPLFLLLVLVACLH